MDFQKLKEEVLKKKSWAVVGVTVDKDRFGYKIWKKLKEHNYQAYGVNPKYDEIDGEKIYSNLREIDEKIEVVDMVVSPKIGIGILDEIKEEDIEYVFFQPGTYNDKVLAKAKDLGLKYISHDCIYRILKDKE